MLSIEQFRRLSHFEVYLGAITHRFFYYKQTAAGESQPPAALAIVILFNALACSSK